MSKKQAKESESTPPNFEQAMTRLESIVGQLEEGEIGLSEALARYEEGVGLLGQCHQLLEKAERKIELLSGFDADGNPVTQSYEDEPAATLEEKARSRSRRRSSKQPVTRRPSAESKMDEPPTLF